MLILYWEAALGSKNKRYKILNELQALTGPDYLLCCRILGGVEREEEIKAGIAQSSGGRLHPWSARSVMLLRLLLGIIPPKVENGQAEQLFIMKRYNFSFLFSPAWIRT